MKNEDLIREKLSELEHIQWEQWSKEIAKELKQVVELFGKLNLSDSPTCEMIKDRLSRWKDLWIPYEELQEQLKDFDREWADKAIKIFKSRCED